MSNAKSQKAEYLIIGQGLAGTLLAWFLMQSGRHLKVIDRPLPGATSSIAAGIINPVTGRRMAKSWRFETFFPFAMETYIEIGHWLGVRLWEDKSILRALPTVFEENEWHRRGAFPEFAPFFAEEAHLGNYKGKVTTVRTWGELLGAAKVDLPQLIRRFREVLQEKGLLIEAEFDYEKVDCHASGMTYQGDFYTKAIFCEGARAVNNPYFNYLPFVPTKGELLLVRIPQLKGEKLLKNHIFIVPVDEDLYWVGSTSRFEYEGPEPTRAKRQYLASELERVLTVPFEIIDHQAGIRPTVDDKRPFLGLHPACSGLAIFNGLGTKGASMAPFFAKQLTRFLLEECPLDPEVDISRYPYPDHSVRDGSND